MQCLIFFFSTLSIELDRRQFNIQPEYLRKPSVISTKLEERASDEDVDVAEDHAL